MRKLLFLISVLLLIAFLYIPFYAIAGSSGVTPGAMYQAYRVQFLIEGRMFSVLIEPGTPYFSAKMTNLLIDQIQADCSDIVPAVRGCGYAGLTRLELSDRADFQEMYPFTPDAEPPQFARSSEVDQASRHLYMEDLLGRAGFLDPPPDDS